MSRRANTGYGDGRLHLPSGHLERDESGIAGQYIRLDRILDEAHATGGDIRQLMDLFGLSVHSARRYIATVSPDCGGRSRPQPDITGSTLDGGQSCLR